MSAPAPTPDATRPGRAFLVLLLSLAAVLGFLFRDSFRPEMAMFANDGPLGMAMSRTYETPGAFFGVWSDLNWLGGDSGNLPPDLTGLLMWLLPPLLYNKFFAATSVFILGLCAFLFFRQLRFHPAVCIVGGLAAALNSDFLSYACWGLGTLPLCVASIFLCLAALVSTALALWKRLVLGGAALGLALMEGFDNGAIFSLYIAAFAAFQALWEGTRGKAALGGAVLRVAGVAIVSAATAVHVLITLVQGNIAGIEGMGQDEQSRAARWNFATQWSLPPRETLRAVIPGLYGYRMDTGGGGQYWGRVGMDPSWDAYWESRAPRDPSRRPPALIRYSGAGHYTGVMVVLLAAFAIAQSFSKGGGQLTGTEQRWVWFWGGAALLSLLFAFGRFAPFYHLIYSLPYFSTIRNPVKFLHPLNLSLVVLSAYGLQAAWRGWIARSPGTLSARGKVDSSTWWSRLGAWERRWIAVTAGLVAVGVLAWLIYGSQRQSLLTHLAEVGFEGEEARAIARFSQAEVGLFAVTLAASAGLLAVVLGGWFSRRPAAWAGTALAAVVVLDLARANAPWIIHYNWRERYATNPLFDVLRQAPHEGRVTGQLGFQVPGQAGQLQQSLSSVYALEWIQHQFRFYDIQSLDIVQMPRTPADYAAYKRALAGNPVREWELSNTRWLLSLAPLVDPINQQLDPARKSFRLHTGFTLSQTPSGVIQVQTNTSGPFGLLEFTGALPRAMLFDRWRTGVPDDEALALLASTNFNPHLEVLVAESAPGPSVDTATQPAGKATYLNYSPKRFTLETETRTPCVLLVNDRYDPRWKVRVDGQPEPLLRANYIARGVYLKPGKHQVEFSYEPPTYALWISVAVEACILGLLGQILVTRRREE